MGAKKEIDKINDIDSFIYFFKKNINFDYLIEKKITELCITDDLSNNDKEMVKFFIDILKESKFKEIKLLFTLLLIRRIKASSDNIESDSSIKNDYYNVVIKKIVFFFINRFLEDQIITSFKEEEGDIIETLVKSISENFNSKMIRYIYKKVEKIEDNDNSIKYAYFNNHDNILFAFKKFINVLHYYGCLISALISVYIATVINRRFSLKVFLKTVALNIYYIVLFNTTYRKTKIIINNNNPGLINKNIDNFFNNISIIIEKNTLREELNNTSNMIYNEITKGGVDEKYRLEKVSKSNIKNNNLYNFYETITSILIDDKVMLSETDIIRGICEHFARDMTELKFSLKNTNGFIEVINVKPYKVSKTIQWNTNDNYEYLFILENIKLQYEYKDQKGDTVINKIVENVNINFEYGSSHIFIGNSGCGKTTILNAIMKRMKSTNGVIKFLGIHDDYTYYSIRKYLTYLKPESALFCKDIYFNIIYGLHKKTVNKNKDNIMQTIIKYMKLLKLEEYIENIKIKNACELSKGQTQKVAIIRLFINIIFNDVRILFLDEITSNIDNKVEAIIYTELRNIQKIYRFTTFFVSHNMANIIYSDYTYRIDLDESKIYKKKTEP